jgi:MscS family membrane protein
VFSNFDGIVEDIGLRSTKIRLFNGHQVTFPNDKIANSNIENAGRRPHIRRIINIQIPLDTPREKVEKAVEIVRNILHNHEGMHPDFPARVYLNDFNPDAFNLRAFYWYRPPNFWEYMEFGHKVNTEIFLAFEENGIGFSLPFRVAHTTMDDKERTFDINVHQSPEK